MGPTTESDLLSGGRKGFLAKDNLFQRVQAAPIENLPVALPRAKIDDSVDLVAAVTSCLAKLERHDSTVFTEKDPVWRDLYALTGTLRTFYGMRNINLAWTELLEKHHQSAFSVVPDSLNVVRVGSSFSWVQGKFTFETSGVPASLCSGIIGIIPDGKTGWKIWLLTTILEQLKGYPNPDLMDPQVKRAVTPKALKGQGSPDFDCVVVGAGFAGLCLAARLKAVGISSVTLERNVGVGDQWIDRYDSARFHTSRDYSDMPIERIFTENDPYFLSGADLAKGYSRYAKELALNIWLSTNLESATFDEESYIWTLFINKAGSQTTIKTRHFVLAIGGGGTVPVIPDYPNKELFRGKVLHSASYKNSSDWKGLKGVVVGTANTAHDVADDMVESGLSSVTMIQRGRTCVFPIEYYKEWSDPIYNVNFPIEEADRIIMATPLGVIRQISRISHNLRASEDFERFDALERAGFRVERFGDLWKLLSQRLGGHYIDVGTSQKVADGLIKVKGDAALASYTPTGFKFSDGSVLDADVIVFCTGFEHDIRKEATKIVGPEIGEKLEDYWDIDVEGELRGVYKPMSYPGIWYAGGGVTYARFYTRFLALQIKADIAGTPLSLYTKKSV